MMISDEKIIEKVLEGETDLFRLLVERYHERIFILLRGFVHQIEDAEDVTQETFIKAFISLGSFKG
ncbi:MAG: sigma factor, partial [Bacteroidales bacterium]